MADRWFRLPETGAGSTADPYAPDLFGHGVDGWAGNKIHPDGSPQWVVRVYADSATLDGLASEAGAVELTSVPTTTLNQMFGQERTDEGWREGFRVG